MELIDKNALLAIPYAYPITRAHIVNAPTVDAVPVGKGLWIADSQISDLYHCSICGFVDHREPKARYCSDCGATMEGGE